jgi:hypothetical protein
MAGSLLSWYDRSLLNKPILFKAKLLYHGTTISYYKERMGKGQKYFQHQKVGSSGSKFEEVMFETKAKSAVAWACSFAQKYNDEPVLLVISTKKLRDLRRTVGYFYPYHRADKVAKEDLVMIPLKFKNDKWKSRTFLSQMRDLTDDCKKKIIKAEAKMLSQF